MTTNTALLGSLAAGGARGRFVPGLKLAAFSSAHFVGLSQCYHAALSPSGRLGSLADARAVITATLRGDYGAVLPGASPTALLEGAVVGSLQVVSRVQSDSPSSGPVAIALFVHPDFRHRGIAATMLAAAASRLQLGGFTRLAVGTRKGALTAEAAESWRRAGFSDLEAGGTDA
jgi:GNAT superfamily N-acetyltransferase